MSTHARRLGTLAAAAAAAIVALAINTPPAFAVVPATTTDPAAAAAGWLSQQLVGGTHLVYAFDGKTFDGGGTADAVYALAAAKTGKNTIDDAIAYFEKHVDEYTSVSDTTGKPGPFDGSLGKAALAAFVAGADPTSFGGFNLLQTLKDDECTAESGDLNDFTVPVCPAAGAARNIYSSISESLVVTAEARGAALDAQYAPSSAGLAYLLSLQCTNGGFTSGTVGGTGCTSDPDATGYAAMALQAVGGQSAALAKAAAWLALTRNADGSWNANGGANVDSTGLAAAGLSAAGRAITSSRAWLVGQQVTAGPTVGAGASRGALKYQGKFDPAASVKGTSDGVLGLIPGTSLATLDDHGAAAVAPVLALDDPAVTKATVRAAGAQTVTGTGFSAGEQVTGVLHAPPGTVGVGTAKANATGTAALHFTVPASTAAGVHTLTLTGATSALSSSVSFTVAAAAPASSSTAPATTVAPTASSTPSVSNGPVLADTGRDGRQTHAEVLLGASLLALGGAALLLGRRRRTPRHRR